MPTYEFRCPEGHEFEKFYRTIGGAEAHAACPICGQPAERMMSAAGFAFKGSGFYLTDYGKNAHREKGTEPRKPATESATASGESSTSDSGKESSAARAESTSDGARPDSKGDGAKSDGAKSADSSSAGSSSNSNANSSANSHDKSKSKPVEKKPAAEPKKSAGE